LDVFTLNQIADVGAGPSQNLKLITLISHEIIFEVFQPMWSGYPTLQTDGRTDRQTMYRGI